VGVVATSAATNRSVVFHDGLASPPPDHLRGIDYVKTPLSEEQVLASAAIPAVFPAVHVDAPRRARGWYFDGGTRLNTPLKPALEGAGQILSGLLGDQLTSDVQTLATINTLTRATRVTPGKKRGVGQALINLGRQDARRWLGRSHDLDGLWQIAPSAAT
jgi:predicted acylesterase/phospholipase RssA